jgi:hypothetical protein
MIARRSDTRKTSLPDGLAEHNRYVNWWLNIALAVLIIFPLTMLAIYCANLPVGGLMAYGAAAMVSAASALAGALPGFLFGIPRALTGDAESGSSQQQRLIANTNLEQVSDWLTKIIVGATLVQLGNLTRRFGELATSVSGIFGTPSAQNKTMAGAIILYAAVFGFFGAYIAARSIITFLFYLSPSDWIRERQDILAKRGLGAEEGSPTERTASTKTDDP